MAKNLQAGLRQSIKASRKAGVTGAGIFSLAPLDLRFALQKTLDPRVTFTRASTGTFVGSDGLLQSAVTNLLTYSEQFDNASWIKQSSVSVSANTTVAPNGTLTADTITWTSASVNTGIYAQILSGLAASVAHTRSIYVRADSAGGTVQLTDPTLTVGITTINLTTEWQRIQLTENTPIAGSAGVWVRKTASSPNTIYLWGAQLEQSSTAGEYIPTTSTINSAPRFDHNPTTGESLGLLVEEARTNLALRSEEFDNASWILFGTASRTANTTVAPDGTTTADSVTLPTSSGIFQYVTGSASITYTFSVWIKCSTTQTVRLLINTNLSDPTTLTVTATSSFQRFSVTKTTSVGTVTVAPQIDTGGGNTFVVWGAQLEVGAFPTSYIPTTTATATRAADVASITGTAFSSFYNQTEGTVFAAYDQPAVGCSIAVIDDGTTNNSSVLFSSSVANQRVSSNMLVASANQGRIDAGGTFTANVLNRAALAVSASGRGLSCNGSAVSTSANPSSMPSLSRLAIQGDNTFVSQKGGHIQRLTYWPVRLANSTLQAITTS